MGLDSVLGGERGGVGEAAQLLRPRLALEMGVAAGMEFDDRRLEPDRRLDLARVGLDEQADPDVRLGEAGDAGEEVVVLAGGVEPALRWSAPRGVSGTRQAAWGRWRRAISSISSVAAISRFKGMVSRSISAEMSSSRMWRRSSRRWAVIPSAPASAASRAARTGSGRSPPRAFRMVATWSILTPRRRCEVTPPFGFPACRPEARQAPAAAPRARRPGCRAGSAGRRALRGRRARSSGRRARRRRSPRPPAASTARIASRELRPVVTTSSTRSTFCPGARRKPRRSSNVPVGRSRNIASRPSERPISWPMMTPPIAGETTASMRLRISSGRPEARAWARRDARAGSISTRAHCR